MADPNPATEARELLSRRFLRGSLLGEPEAAFLAAAEIKLPEPLPLDGPTLERATAMVEPVSSHLMENLPDPESFPGSALRLMELVDNPDVQVNQLIGLVSQDPAVSATILRCANSAFYARGGAVQNLAGAVRRLGLREVARIATGVASRSLYDVGVRVEFAMFGARWASLFHEALTCGFLSGWLATERRTGDSSRAFLGGMFHHIGKSIGLRSVAALKIKGQLPADILDLEIDLVLEQIHIEIGVDLMSLWSLPSYLMTMCEHHHNDAVEGSKPSEVDVVRLCAGLYELAKGPCVDPGIPQSVAGSARLLRMDPAQLRAAVAKASDFGTQVSSMFSV